MQETASEEQIQQVIERLIGMGFEVHRSTGARQTVLGAVGARHEFDIRDIEVLPGVGEAHRISSPYKLVARSFRPEGTVVKFKRGVSIGGDEVVLMAGPCSVESRDQIFAVAESVAHSGAKFLRGGAFKPRSSPYSFQGMGEDGLKLMREAADQFGMLVVSEVMEISQIPVMLPYVDLLQVGARNMQNFSLLEAVGGQPKAVMLKRGLSATIQEFLMAAEYILKQGNYKVVLCERGIRTFEPMTRNTLDLGSIPLIKRLTHLPIIVDPSHGTGDRASVPAMARAAVALGADGLMVEVHPEPEKALSDGPQSLTPAGFAALMESVRAIAPLVGLSLGPV
jgi:3-deoxy-7-phosphoheptulonate synthase